MAEAALKERKLEPNFGIKSKKPRGNTYLGPGATKTLPSKVPEEIKELKKDNQKKSLELINNNIEKAIQVWIDGLDDKDKWYRYNCACALIKKVLPDKKHLSGKLDNLGKTIVNNYIDKRTEVTNILSVLDEMGFDELRQRATDGNVGLLESPPGREGEKEAEILGEEGAPGEGDRPGKNSGAGESPESTVSTEDAPRRRRVIRRN